MRQHPDLDWLLNCNKQMLFTAPGKYVLTWPLPPDKSYDVVCGKEGESQVPAGKWGTRADPKAVQHDFLDFCPTVVALLKRVDSCVKWTLAELPPLETCRSSDGRVVLLGDAWHAMLPHSGSGGSSAIEDAAVLGECVTWAYKKGLPIGRGTDAYETLQKSRVERMQAASREGRAFFAAGGDMAEARNIQLANVMKATNEICQMTPDERMKKMKIDPDMNAPFPSPPYMQWLRGYDAMKETRAYLDTLAE